MALSCSQTHRLYSALGDLYAISEGGLPPGGKRFAVVDPEQATVVEGEQHHRLKAILDSEGDGFWAILEDLQPGLLQTVMLRKQYEARRTTVEEFRRCIVDPTIDEDAWYEFFEKNEWIFGHGLDYRYLRRLQSQPSYGGVELDGKGGLRGDYLMVTIAHVRFTVLVEIKKPFTELLGKKHYRSKAYELGLEMTGAVSQVQAQCAQWALEGARQSSNWERLVQQGIHTCEPKGIIIIGTTQQIADDPDKRNTFERFRRNLHNPEVITFDELLARAEFVVEQLGAAQAE